MRKMVIGIAVLAACGSKGDGKGGKGGKDGAVEAHVQLKRMADRAKQYFVAHDNVFPVAEIGPTPAKPCCDQPDHTCRPDPADWAGDWSQLSFDMNQPSKFQYSYKGTAQEFTAIAVGDPDCDGHKITITATGTAPAGNPTVTFSDQ